MTDPDILTSPRPVMQRFRSKDGEPLASVQAKAIGPFGHFFVYWSDIQEAFNDVSYLLDSRGERVLFEVIEEDDDYKL